MFGKICNFLKKDKKNPKKDVDTNFSLWYSCNVVRKRSDKFHKNLIVKVYTKFLEISRILIKQNLINSQ